jgi:hypothetical protein
VIAETARNGEPQRVSPRFSLGQIAAACYPETMTRPHLQPEPAPPETPDDLALLAFLETNERPCPACGYNVHRLREARCPECGAPLLLRLVPLEGTVARLWAAAIVVAAAGAGVGLFCAAVVMREGWPPLMPRSREFLRMVQFNIVLLFFLGTIPLPLPLLLLRRWFVRMPRSLQGTCVATWTALTVAMGIWFLVLIVR